MKNAPWVAAALAAAFYFALAPTVTGPDDAGELTLAMALAGVPHPTGYPLYVGLGHVFVICLRAFGATWSHAANAWSAAGGAVAIALYSTLAFRLAGRDAGARAWVAPSGAIVLLAIHPVWTNASMVAEVYSWAFAWHAGASLWALTTLRRIASGTSGGAGAAAAWGLIAGVGLAHHLVSMWLVLALTAALALAARRAGAFRWSWIGWGTSAALLPIASYGWIAWRAYHPAAFQWPLLEASPGSIWAHCTGHVYRFYVGHFAPATGQVAGLRSTLLPLLIPGMAACALLAWRERDPATRGWLIAMLAAAALELGFAASYGVPDPAVYFVPPLMMALLALPLAARRAGFRWRPWVTAGALLLPLALGPGWIGEVVAQRRRLDAVEHRIREVWRSIPFQRGIVLWNDEHYTRLRLYQVLGGERPGLDVENPSMLTWRAPRAAFVRRWGFDPLEGLELRDDSDLAAIPANVARQASVPVLDFAAYERQLGSR